MQHEHDNFAIISYLVSLGIDPQAKSSSLLKQTDSPNLG
jgi:hypothetical protein